MSQQDPTELAVPGAEHWMFEQSVDEVSQAQAADAAAVADPTQPWPGGRDEAPGAPPPVFAPQGPAAPVPIQAAKRPVSGRYRGQAGAYQLELRVDVDRTRPLKRLSGDFFQVSGGTTSYTGSFVVHAPTIKVTATTVTVRGLGNFTTASSAPVVQVTILRRSVLLPPGAATVQFFTSANTPGSAYTCAFESAHFRTVKIETDRVSNVTTPVFNSYNTGAQPSGGPARSLRVVSAYAEAGSEMVTSNASDVIQIGEAGAGATWSNAELHASMQAHFSLWQNTPQWTVWQVVCQLHDLGPSLYGIMFDQLGKQRQGCAVFHQGIGGTTAEKLRLQLYTYVHELGHSFNLLHSWQKSLANPPSPDRPLSLSWMNYPFNYPAPGGEATYWNNFAFQFDNEELLHLRHAFRNNIIIGGSNFAVGSALDHGVMPEPERDDSGLRLGLSTHQRKFALGEPVVLQIALTATDSRGRRVHTWLHPNCSLVQIVIRKPSGAVLRYEPLIDHLVGPRDTVITGADVLRDSAYIGYGRDGHYFDQPGNYQVRASYAALDGSMVVSDILNIRVAYPVTAAEEDLADLFMGDEQGTLLYLLGSDDESLQRGNAAFDEVLAKYPKHAMATYARLVKGINAGRDFKTISDDREGRLDVRKAQPEASAALLSAVSAAGVLDAVSAEMSLGKLAQAQTLCGDEAAAAKTLSQLSAQASRPRRTGRKPGPTVA